MRCAGRRLPGVVTAPLRGAFTKAKLPACAGPLNRKRRKIMTSGCSRRGISRTLSTTFPLKKPKVPQELWGAWNAVKGALTWRSGQSHGVVAEASSAVAAPSQPLFDPSGIAARLDYQPELKWWQLSLILASSAAICTTAYIMAMPRKFSLSYAVGTGILFAALIFVLRKLAIEQQYTAQQQSEEELADSEGLFGNFEGLRVHYKCKIGSNSPTLGMHLYHGFGANLYSWGPVHARLAQSLNACVTAHDTPGFGLTSRPAKLSAYSLATSGRLGCLVLEKEVSSAQGGLEAGTHASESSDTSARAGLAMDAPTMPEPPTLQRILVGHSMGSLSVALDVVDNPHQVKALVFSAPAILALSSFRSRSDTNDKEPLLQTSQSGLQSANDTSNRQPRQALTGRIAAVLAVLWGTVWRQLVWLFLWVSQPVSVFSLRSLVRSRAFWKRGLANAYFQPGYEERLINSYRLPSLVRGWEWGLVRFTRSRLERGKQSFAQRVSEAWTGQKELSTVQRIANVVEKHNIPVLIVHGVNDKIIPVNNSRRLATLIPGAKLVEYADCGHVPHEEYPERFVDDVKAVVAGS
ncbi:unnamed protein product [Ostreobium quekettii]|uniref:AB hydrolase-1 domain-containing protein n=1 Tax=Ostreobium quekettii TaxID=121088 RepID=A0A8S1JC24_9CHLO|nr:unnamed protein product [Ostreobium quekettii]|eukprot:evm.model.scf_441EXC.3 EVM.evm.TU.scf_441EXC.3   scf_441EXC:13141-18518(+)